MPRMFTRTAYRQLAAMMQRVHDETPLSGTAEKLWLHTCASLACMLDDDSPYFQAERFYSACQPGADVSRVCGDNGHDGI
jgi:hypothetical protein